MTRRSQTDVAQVAGSIPESPTIRALRIIDEAAQDFRAGSRREVISPREFAQLMWPDSPGWQRSHRCGYGASRGAMMPKVGGGFLGRLYHRGLITTGNRLTDAGKALVVEASPAPNPADHV